MFCSVFYKCASSRGLPVADPFHRSNRGHSLTGYRQSITQKYHSVGHVRSYREFFYQAAPGSCFCGAAVSICPCEHTLVRIGLRPACLSAPPPIPVTAPPPLWKHEQRTAGHFLFHAVHRSRLLSLLVESPCQHLWTVAPPHRSELDSEHAQKVLEMEHAQQVKLKERQKFFEEAFQQDMEQYLSAGYLQIAERREPIGSMSSMEVNVDILEQLELMDVSDQEALDVFLNSGAEDSSMTSPVLDSEPALLPTDLVLQVPAAADHCSKLSSMSSSCTEDSVSQETAGTEEASGEDVASPVVQSDEEEVQADTALVTLPESQALPNSDDSDSPAL
ncbi:dysbindin-A-like isoform X6 [Paramormyrops kingsleyae]|uniref:dysbindin-A-like isoform X6 n=1 Tax=Paramormyrops kingsleyae TaxID=1676925 RepID=UPI003B96CE94